MQLSSRITALCVASVLALGLAGCDDDEPSEGPQPNGVEDLKAAEIVKRSLEATKEVSDLTYAGRVTFAFETGTQRVRGTTTATEDGACEVVLSSKEVGRMTVRLVGRTSYVKGDDKILAEQFGAGPDDLEVLRGKWLSGAISAEDAKECSLAQYSTGSVDKGSCRKGKEGDVDGAPTITLKCEEDGRPTTMHVATTGDPLVLRVTGLDEDGPFELTLTGHDEGTTVVAPPKRDVIDTTVG